MYRKPIDARRGIWRAIDEDIVVDKKGVIKTARTIFERIAYNEKSNTSLVFCAPLTGRCHQIREHLRYLGFLIINNDYEDERTEETYSMWNLKKPEFPPANINSMYITLHAWKYEFENGYEFETKTLPSWAQEFGDQVLNKTRKIHKSICAHLEKQLMDEIEKKK